jgi:hypothetical protein
MAAPTAGKLVLHLFSCYNIFLVCQTSCQSECASYFLMAGMTLSKQQLKLILVSIKHRSDDPHFSENVCTLLITPPRASAPAFCMPSDLLSLARFCVSLLALA